MVVKRGRLVAACPAARPSTGEEGLKERRKETVDHEEERRNERTVQLTVSGAPDASAPSPSLPPSFLLIVSSIVSKPEEHSRNSYETSRIPFLFPFSSPLPFDSHISPLVRPMTVTSRACSINKREKLEFNG